MKFISILWILLATISCSSSQEKEVTAIDTVIVEYVDIKDTIVIDTVKLKCKKSLESQMQRVEQMETKLDRLKKRINKRKERRAAKGDKRN